MVEEDGMWRADEEGTADSAKNHRMWNEGVNKHGRFITKLTQDCQQPHSVYEFYQVTRRLQRAGDGGQHAADREHGDQPAEHGA